MRRSLCCWLAVSLLGAVVSGHAGLVGYWRFDEGAGTAIVDSSGRGNHGTLVNAQAGTWTNGVSGPALYFDGSVDTRVVIPHAASQQLTTGMTVAAWVNMPITTGDRPILAKEGNGQLGYWFGVFQQHFGILLDNDGGVPWDADDPYRTVGSVPVNQWIHLACTWDGATVRYYTNGIPLSVTLPHTGPLFPSTATLTIGVNSDWNFTRFLGVVDEVQLYDSALSDAQIRFLYQNAGAAAVPLAFLRCNGPDGSSTFTDESGRTWIPAGNVRITDGLGKWSQCAAFDGDGDSLTADDVDDFRFGSDPFTIDFWMKPRDLAETGAAYLMGRSNPDGGQGFDIRYDHGEILVSGVNGWAFNIGTDGPGGDRYITPGQWHHIAVVAGTDTVRLFVNGQLKGTCPRGTITDGGNPFRIGFQTNYGGTAYYGYLDDIRIRNYAVWTDNFTPDGFPTVTLLGASSLTNECFTPFTDPGAIARNVVVPIASSHHFNLALRPDGTAVGWGRNHFGQTDVPAAATNLVAVSTGQAHSLALRADGTVVAWGNNFYGQATVPPEATDVIAIAAGYAYNLVLRSDRTLFAWGWDFGGATTVPAEATNVVAIAAGDAHGLALRADGTVVAWGLNNAGQATVPPNATNIVAIAAGLEHSMALRQDGQVIVWGGAPPPPPEATNIVAIAGGFGFCLALSADGQLYTWGTNDPGNHPDAANFIAIAAGQQHALALRRDGRIVAWGINSYGQTDVPAGLRGNTAGRVIRRTAYTPEVLGRHTIYYTVAGAFGGSATTSRTVVNRDTTPPVVTLNGSNPVTIATTNDYVEAGATATDPCNGVAAIAGGFYHNLALKSDRTVVAWGRNLEGQCNIPTGATNTVAIAAGGPYSASLQADGRVLVNGFAGSMWGDPTPPADATNLVAVAVGGVHLLGLQADGTVRAWGYNGSGQTTVPANATDAIAVATGNNFSMALRADGTVVAWGDNSYGQTNVPAAATNIIAIAAGEVTALALKADGTVIGWGDDSMGQIPAPTGLSNVVAISCGARQSLALLADGNVVAWGSFPAVTNIPPNVTNAVAISCGYFHNVALLATGEVVVWGANDYGQGNVPAGLTDVITNITITGTLTSGTNVLTYTAVDAAGNTGTVQRTVIVTNIPPLTITKQQAKVNFAKPLSDSASFMGAIGLPNDFAPSNSVVTVDIGGVVTAFVLDARARAKLSNGSSCMLKKSKLGGWLITVKLGKGNYAAAWADEGLTNETVVNKPVTLPVTVTAGGQVFTGSKPLLYRATQGRGGTAR